MPIRQPTLRQLLKGLSIPIALSLAATLFSGNTLNLLNGWFNGSFNTITYSPQGDVASPPITQSETADAEAAAPHSEAPISIHFDPIITFDPADIQIWNETSTGNAPTFTFTPTIDINSDHHNPSSIDFILPPVEIRPWLHPQGTGPNLEINGQLLPFSFALTLSSQAAPSPSFLEGPSILLLENHSLFEIDGEGDAKPGQIWASDIFVETSASLVFEPENRTAIVTPEPGLWLGFGIIGFMLKASPKRVG